MFNTQFSIINNNYLPPRPEPPLYPPRPPPPPPPKLPPREPPPKLPPPKPPPDEELREEDEEER